MTLTIQHQDSYSRGELLLRTLFGWLYIAIPHGFVLFFMSIWSSILTFIAFWAILFTGKYPQSFFEFQVGLIRWNIRLSAVTMNLIDGYPAFGISSTDEKVNLQIENPESLSRGLLLLKILLGWLYVALPHGFVLMFRMLATFVLMFLAWWVVLIAGTYPQSWHNFNVGTIRWSTRLNLYLQLMSDDYPPFSGKE